MSKPRVYKTVEVPGYRKDFVALPRGRQVRRRKKRPLPDMSDERSKP